ncbi:MAG: hypothetical protein RIN55_02430 [Tissierellaceae bacterium]|nr:hypothetical protein [Tissierellaceae bacterium]
MTTIDVRVIKAGSGKDNMVPLNIVFVDKKDIENANVTDEAVINAIAKEINGPVGINIFDMDAVTTTSDGIMVEGAIVKMAAGDMGKIHKEFGILEMEYMEVTDELISEEPHLLQWKENFQGRRLFRGPNPAKKLIPVHNVVMTGRAINNNSATEMMNAVTMEEILLPILGQLQIMRDGEVLMGITGGVVSVGIGMTVAEKYGRVFPTRQFKAGETAHGSGEYAQTLKQHIPIIVATKPVLAENILRALKAGCIPGLHIGCSPAVLAVAKAFGAEIAFDNIEDKAIIELESVGVSMEALKQPSETLSEEEIIKNAADIIPGVVDPTVYKSEELVTKISLEI